MVHRFFGAVCVAWLLCAPITGNTQAPPAAATPADEARARFLKGKELYSKGDFDGAVREWEAAYNLVPTPELHFNIGRAFEQGGHVEAAVARYQRYLQDTKDPPDRPSVEATIKRLQEQVNRGKKDTRKEEQAAARFKKGRELYQASQYREALLELQGAFDLFPSATLVYNMAKTREKLGDLPGALKDYRRYLEMEPKASDRGDVEYIIRALEKRLTDITNELSLESNPAGADVFLDEGDKIAGQTPLNLKVSGGSHKLRVEKNGFEVASREFAMPADRPLTLTFDLRPLENVGWLSVECDQDASHIFLDGTILALTPYKERRALAPGNHQVVLEHEGFRRVVQMVEVKQGRETHVRINLESQEGRSKAPLVLAPLLGGALGVVAAAALGTSGVLGFRARNVVDGTRAWQMAMAGMSVSMALGVVSLVAAAASVVGLVVLYAVLGATAARESEVTVRPTVPTEKPAGGAP
jgi:tetratricopeptide (TPR) repeat protein